MERGSIVEKLVELAPLVLAWALAVVGGASALAAGIAPLTKTDKDDKLAAFLKKVLGWLDTIALNPKR